MLYDRTYMKSPNHLFSRSFCDQLIILLISCFLLQAIFGLILSLSTINNIFAFGISNIKNGYVWSVLTYGLLHDGPLHLLFNLLGIHFIGRPVEELLGRPQFITLTVIALIMGLIAWLPFNNSPQQYIVGASAIVLGTLCIFCLRNPNQPITLLLFFILPITIKPKWVLCGTLVLELYGFLFTELSGYGGIAHSAHLGGMFAGLLFFLHNKGSLGFPLSFKFITSTKSRTSKVSRKHMGSRYRVNFGAASSLKEETDRILDKINEKGFGSLTDSEKETLENAKKLLGK